MKFKPRNGTGAIIITPTRELALQINGVLADVIKGHSQTFGVIMGGANRNTEEDKLNKGINVVVATPGRLLDHLQVWNVLECCSYSRIHLDLYISIFSALLSMKLIEYFRLVSRRKCDRL